MFFHLSSCTVVVILICVFCILICTHIVLIAQSIIFIVQYSMINVQLIRSKNDYWIWTLNIFYFCFDAQYPVST